MPTSSGSCTSSMSTCPSWHVLADVRPPLARQTRFVRPSVGQAVVEDVGHVPGPVRKRQHELLTEGACSLSVASQELHCLTPQGRNLDVSLVVLSWRPPSIGETLIHAETPVLSTTVALNSRVLLVP